MIALLVLLTLWPAPSQPGEAGGSPPDHQLTVNLNQEDQRFDLTLTSRSEQTFCVHRYSWPSKDGELHFASTYVYVDLGGERCPIADRNRGLCLGNECLIRLLPGTTLTGFIPFSEFECPLADETEMTLILPIPLVPCE